MTYRALIRSDPRFVACGFLLCFFSSFGQTFFLGVFGGTLRAEFDLSHSGFGLVYSLATLTSAFLLLRLGKALDHVDLRRYTLAVTVGLTLACLVMAWSPHVVVLFAGLLGLRLCGQGLMSHTGLTSMARYFDTNRAKAISLAAMGFAVGEACWPRGAIAVMQNLDWRWLWLGLGGIAALVVTPLLQWLLRGHTDRHEAFHHRLSALEAPPSQPAEGVDPEPAPAPARQWTQREVLADPRFYLLIPSVLAPPMIVTGMFFHQVQVADLQGWTMEWYATCFIGYAIAQFVTGVLTGPLVDRVGARPLFPWTLVPLLAGLAVLLAGDHGWICLIYLGLAGVTLGLTGTIVPAMWAEVYGVRHLGAIRSLANVLMVFSTALSPIAMGLLFDGGATLVTVCVTWIVYGLVASTLAWLAVAPRTTAQPG